MQEMISINKICNSCTPIPVQTLCHTTLYKKRNLVGNKFSIKKNEEKTNAEIYVSYFYLKLN